MTDLIHRTDRKIVANPCEGTKLPKAEQAGRPAPTIEQVAALTEAMPRELGHSLRSRPAPGCGRARCSG